MHDSRGICSGTYIICRVLLKKHLCSLCRKFRELFSGFYPNKLETVGSPPKNVFVLVAKLALLAKSNRCKCPKLPVKLL
jgi:hypothetical protein